MNSNVENKKMETAMADLDLKAAVLYKASQFASHCETVVNDTNVKEGETYEEYVNRMESNVDILHNGFNKVLTAMSDATGFTFIKDSIYKIMDAGLEGDKGKKDLLKMVDKYKALVQEELDFMAAIGNEQSIKDAIMLKSYTEDERGKSIFESFFGAVIWIGNRVARKLRQWFKIDDEKSIMNALCRKLSFIGNTLRKGGRFVFNAFNLLMGYVVAGTIKVVEVVSNFLISAFAKVKEWATAKFTKAEEPDVTEQIVTLVRAMAGTPEEPDEIGEEERLDECEADNRKARIAEIKAEIARLEAKKARLS